MVVEGVGGEARDTVRLSVIMNGNLARLARLFGQKGGTLAARFGGPIGAVAPFAAHSPNTKGNGGGPGAGRRGRQKNLGTVARLAGGRTGSPGKRHRGMVLLWGVNDLITFINARGLAGGPRA